MKNIKDYLTKESVSSNYRVEPESKKSNVNILNLLSIVQEGGEGGPTLKETMVLSFLTLRSSRILRKKSKPKKTENF